MNRCWLAGIGSRRSGRLAGGAVGVAVAVALLACLGTFLAGARATMTARAAATVPVDWQVEVHSHGDLKTVLGALRATGVEAALPVGYAMTSGLAASTHGTTQRTGSGMVLGLPVSYRDTFPGEVRILSGRGRGVLVAQQTAANLHVAPGDQIHIGRAGLPSHAVTVDGVAELPLADSLFQRVGAPAQSQPLAPPDNVVLLPSGAFDEFAAPLARSRPDLVTNQVHVSVSHNLAPDPATAFAELLAAAHNFEADVSGTATVGNNLGAALDAARSDAAYSQVLFLFLGLPGAVLAALLTAVLVGSGVDRRRREQGLLRTRGASAAQVLRLAAVEALVVAVVGGLLGTGVAVAVGAVAFGSAALGATAGSSVIWMGSACGAGLVVSLATALLPVRRDLRESTAHEVMVGRSRARRSALISIAVVALGISIAVFRAAGRNKYALVLAPEGVPSLSVNYWAFLGPGLLWLAAGLLVWRLSQWALTRGGRQARRLLRPLAGPMAGTVVATLRRHNALLSRSVTLIALAVAFGISTAVFTATYQQQAEVDAQLTNGADVTVSESPGASVGPDAAAPIAATPGVNAAEPLQHRFAYVGSDLQDLYGIHPSTLTRATTLQDAYVQGGSAQQILDRLDEQPDGLLVSAETVLDFQLEPGDLLRLRMTDARTQRLATVPFHYVGVANEFPTAPKDSFLVANADYVAQQTHSDAVGAFLVDTDPGQAAMVAAALRDQLGTMAKVTDITQASGVIGSSLTAVDLSSLARVELGFAVVLVIASAGLVVGLSITERRRTFALAAALGATRRQLAGMLTAECGVVVALGVLCGAVIGWAVSSMLVAVLAGVFDPPPNSPAVPWTYLVALLVASVLAAAVAGSALAGLLRRASWRTELA